MVNFSEALDLARKIEGNLVAWRRSLHEIPEDGLDLPLTRAFIKRELEKLGSRCLVKEVKAGILAEIGAKNDREAPGFLLRLDMDALPLKEETGLSFSSRQAGFMHACGHDGNAAVGLGLAKILVENPDCRRVNVRLAFQAGEEILQGARLFVEEAGIESGIALAMHLDPQIPQGKIGLKAGRLNARVDNVRIVVRGAPGHGAYPHLSKDPVVAAAAFIMAAQTIVSRNLGPDRPAVLSFGKIAGGSAPNIIPREVILEGTLRSGGRETAAFVAGRLREMALGTGQSYGVEVDAGIEEVCPPVVCNPGVADWAVKVLQPGLGADNIVFLDQILMGGDDFAFFSQVMPALLLRIGTRAEERGYVYPLHSNQFNFDENVLVLAAAVFLQMITSKAPPFWRHA